jgi:hypothetical protein
MDDYSVSPNHRLSFSTDTVSFDTVFTTIGSTTDYFMVYNRNDKALKIDKIVLASGGESGFRLNVDGRRGDLFSDIPIWAKDSLYIAVEVTVDPNQEDLPFVIYDSVVFITNGISQSVVFEAYGQNVHLLKGFSIFDKDTLLTADRPYLIYDSVLISENVTLSVEKGVKFYMHNKAKWNIDGTLKTFGTKEEPVIFRGDRLSNFSPWISFDNISTQWDGMFFRASSFDNELNYTIIRSGVSGLNFAESAPERKKIKIDNSKISNMSANVLFAVNCDIEVANSELSNAGKYLVNLEGGKYSFIHCTLANYMASGLTDRGTITEPCLTLSDTLLPLKQVFFDNCIIDGNHYTDTVTKYRGEILFFTKDGSPDGNDENFNYRFNHCIIKTMKLESNRFIDCLFKKSPLYIKSNLANKDGKIDYIYNFHLAGESAGIGKADRTISELYPVDMDGVNRITSPTGPSIGAYEYVESKKDEENNR